MSRRELSLWGLVYVAAVVFAVGLALVMSAVPSHAAAGRRVADKYVVLKEDSWSATRQWQAPDLAGVGTHTETVIVTGTTGYLYWPDGSSVNKIAPVYHTVCYNLQSQGVLFDGVQVNPYFFDDNTSTNPAGNAVADKGDHACNRQDIPLTDRNWLRMDQSPGWTQTGWLKLQFNPDQHWDFTWGGSKVKYFHPGDDPDIGDWFWCECDFGGASH